MRLDLGARRLLPEWRAMLAPRDLRADLVAGLTVACVALPLSLAIALASDVPPEVGLTTAIVAGLVCAFFGGQSLGVSGPAVAMAVLVGQIVDANGLGGLLIVGLACGVLQLATGMLGLGRLVRLVPVSVVHGFTAGIGVLILIGQLPRALGLPPTDESHVFEVTRHMAELIGDASPIAAAIALAGVLVITLLARRMPRVPAALIAVAVPTLLVWAFGWEVPLLGDIPSSLPAPSLPEWPRRGVGALLGDALLVYAIASLESLLSASALDKLRGPSTPPHDSDQEMIGQGLGNVAVALFGGIPVTSLIARSALNVHAGARTRRAAVVHALVLIAAVYVGSRVVAHVPIAALAAVLLATAIRMLEPRTFLELWRASRTEAIVFAITALAVVGSDLLSGVQVGIALALVVALVRVGRVRGEIHPAHDGSPHHVSFSGALTFVGSGRLGEVRAEIDGLDAAHGLVLDVRHVPSVDASAAGILIDVVHAWRARGGRVALLGPSADVEHRLIGLGGPGLAALVAHSEAELDGVLGRDARSAAASAHRRLLAGAGRFHRQVRREMSPLLERLAEGQAPHTLFLTCADSRVPPNLMTGSHPGELFVVRNIGALLPPSGSETLNDEGAALEYAIEVLGVRNVVVCGHSKCGAMTALHQRKPLDGLPALQHWARGALEITGDLAPFATVDEATRACSVRQLDHLRSYPAVQKALASGAVRLSAWFYDVETAEILEWDPASASYLPLGLAGSDEGASGGAGGAERDGARAAAGVGAS